MPKKKKPEEENREFTRPAGIEGAPKIELTGLSEEEKKKIQLESALIGRGAREEREKVLGEKGKTLFLEQEAKRQEIPEPEIPTIEELKEKTKTSELTPFQENITGWSEKSPSERVEALKTLGNKEVLAAEGKNIVSNAAFMYDVLATAIGRKKGTSTTQAEASFTDATDALRKDISSVKEGSLSYVDALRNLELAAASLNRLESLSKGKGQLNLRYWLDKGFEMDTTIAREQAILNSLREDLLISAQAQRLVQARAGL